ncbi:DedA family protein [Brooklawnia sp.]|uniref:DedA family protein n=1 Tax=Brooklawnia sp. TaxID=2699740 RepID=UPI003C78DFB3
MAAQRPDDELNAPVPQVDAGAEATGEDVASAEPIDQGSGEQEWWEDPGMPWRHKPTRQDIACLAWIGFLGVFSMAMLPLRAWLLGAPERLPWLVALMGSRTGAAGLGSLVRVGAETPFIWPLLVGTLMSIKLDWTYWWAGKLWGRGMIEIWAGQSERAARNYGRMERWADKLGWLGIFIAYVPIPLPIMAVVFVLAGAQGMSWKKFMVLDFFAALIWLIGYFFFGYAVGEPAVALLEAYAKVANYVAIGLVVFVVVASFWRSGKAARVARVAG